MALFTYAVSRPVTMPWFTHIMIALGFLYIIIITLINVVSVGYDIVTYTSTDYNGTHSLWYDKFIPRRDSTYSHRSCTPALLKLNDYISTSSYFNFFLYQLVDFIDPTHVGSTSEIDGVNYTNNAFQDCSISALQLTEYLQPVSPDLKAPAIIGCNTTSSKYLYLQTAADAGTDEVDIATFTSFQILENYPGPVDVNDAIAMWGVMARKLWYSFSRDQSTLEMLSTVPSFLRESLIALPGVSYIRFAYTDTFGGGTPAADSWTLFVSFLNESQVEAVSMQISFLPTGQVDKILTPPSNLSNAELLLAPTIQLINEKAASAKIANFDFWVLMNWLFVSHYWALLLDVGQVSPATFQYNSAGTLVSYSPVRYPSTNNIFVNSTLFDIYGNYLQHTILPLFGYTLPDFSPLNATNQAEPADVSLKLLYTCTDLQLKAVHSLIVNLIVADWAFITSLLTLSLIVGAWWSQREEEGNFCEGCSRLRREKALGQVHVHEGKAPAGNGVEQMPQSP